MSSIFKAVSVAALVSTLSVGSASAGSGDNVALGAGAVAGGAAVAHAINTGANLTVLGSKAGTATLLGSGTAAKAAFVVGGAVAGAAVVWVGYRILKGVGGGIASMGRSVARVN